MLRRVLRVRTRKEGVEQVSHVQEEGVEGCWRYLSRPCPSCAI